MNRKLYYSPCECYFSKSECFDCAVDMVIMEMGWSINCTCIQTHSDHCGGCSLFLQFQRAFAMAEAPYLALARARLEGVGIVYSAEADGVYWGRQDPDLAVSALLKEATTDPISHRALLLLFSDLIGQDLNVPKPLLNFVGDFVSETQFAPKLDGRYPKAHEERDREILNLIQLIVEKTTLKATSNNPNKEKSACHAVARALLVLNLMPRGYESIRRIWLKRQQYSGIDTTRRV